MNALERWFVQRIIAHEVRQGPELARRVSTLYGMVRAACIDEFTEDNVLTTEANLREWFEATQVSANPITPR